MRIKSLFALIVLCLCCAACARPYAGHLPSIAWKPGTEQHVLTKTLDFTFQTVANADMHGIRGYAGLIPGSVPMYAIWFERIVLKVYLKNDTGRIIGTYTVPCLPRPVSEPVNFEVHIDIPPDADREDYFLAFGYSLVLRGNDPDSPKIIRQEQAGY